MPTLNDRFFEFCRGFPRAEAIDSIPLTEEQEARRVASNLRRADFFFENRRIICEVKALEVDTTDKLVEIMCEAGIHPAKQAHGSIVEDLFKELPKGSKLFNHALKLVLVPLTNHFNKGVTQLRDSKILFDLPDAHGLLIILNDSLAIGGPPLVYKRLKKRLLKSDPKAQAFMKDLTRVLYIGETPHLFETPDGDNYINVTLPNPHVPQNNDLETFAFELNAAWAKFNGQTFFRAGQEVEQLLENSKLDIRK